MLLNFCDHQIIIPAFVSSLSWAFWDFSSFESFYFILNGFAMELFGCVCIFFSFFFLNIDYWVNTHVFIMTYQEFAKHFTNISFIQFS